MKGFLSKFTSLLTMVLNNSSHCVLSQCAIAFHSACYNHQINCEAYTVSILPQRNLICLPRKAPVYLSVPQDRHPPRNPQSRLEISLHKNLISKRGNVPCINVSKIFTFSLLRNTLIVLEQKLLRV